MSRRVPPVFTPEPPRFENPLWFYNEHKQPILAPYWQNWLLSLLKRINGGNIDPFIVSPPLPDEGGSDAAAIATFQAALARQEMDALTVSELPSRAEADEFYNVAVMDAPIPIAVTELFEAVLVASPANQIAGLLGSAPWTISNDTENRTIDVSTSTGTDLMNAFCTLIRDQIAKGIES